jgi:hypothetical protein
MKLSLLCSDSFLWKGAVSPTMRNSRATAAVSQYEDEHGPFTPDEIAEADEWARRVTQRRTA